MKYLQIVAGVVVTVTLIAGVAVPLAPLVYVYLEK